VSALNGISQLRAPPGSVLPPSCDAPLLRFELRAPLLPAPKPPPSGAAAASAARSCAAVENTGAARRHAPSPSSRGLARGFEEETQKGGGRG
jgi:hypothetical protein